MRRSLEARGNLTPHFLSKLLSYVLFLSLQTNMVEESDRKIRLFSLSCFSKIEKLEMPALSIALIDLPAHLVNL
ncbi:hypothetical protein L2E82_24810 [Cichorium intybus]|uniref:Uncharacterized protein n=1 Tax=Cichorium intybus TaxID=13427 RepID=A0ACB9E296_CICIN|nr:hypothetical protein L2E82_24810 [Cichorium intybus]